MAARKKGPVFRVTGLSASQPDDELAVSLKTTIDEVLIEDGDSKLAVHLEIVPSCYDKDEKVALVEFRGGDPAFLAELTDKPLTECQLEMGTTDISFDRHFFGFTQLYTPKADASTTADVIAITGLDGHAYGSWRGKGNLGRMWLRDFLRRDLPSCRTMIYGYNSKLSSHGIDTIMDYGRAMLEELKKVRNTEELRKRPLFFIAHSFGGIIMAHCLVKAVQTDEDDHPTIASLHRATYGMLLFGIPHTGLVVDDIQRMVAGQDSHPRGALLEQIRSKSDLLAFQLADFKNLIRDRKVVSFHETLQTRQLEFDSESKSWERTGGYITAMDTESALLQLPDSIEEKVPLDADHSTIVKFDTKDSRGYTIARDRLVQFERDAPNVVAARFARSTKSVRSFTVQPSVSEVSRVEHFVGREEHITEICETLQYDGSRKTAVVHGLGGIGKTQLALAYAQRHRDDYSAVFWVNSKDVDTLKQGYAAAARCIYREHPSLVHLKAVAEGSDLNEAAEAVKWWLSSAGNDRWLVIYDNYDTLKLPGHNEPGTFDIRPFLPEADQGAVLITTRSSQLKLGRPVAVRKLQNIKHSLEILSQTSRRDGLSLDTDARKLADELDGLPLALATAGAYLHQVSTSFADYLKLYKKSWLRLQKSTPKLLSYGDRALYSTWNISFDHVKQQSELAAKLLQLWAYFDNQDVWLELLQEGRRSGSAWFSELVEDQLSFNAAVRVLCDHALVEENTRFGDNIVESRGYSMHRCVHLWTTHVVNNRWDDRMAGLALICVGLHVPKKDRLKYWVLDRRLIRHANRCRQSLGSRLADQDYDTSTFDAIGGLGNLYARHDELDKAEEMYLQALAGFEKALGSSHTLTLQTVDYLGLLYADQGKLDAAEEMFERALRGKEEALGVGHSSTLDTVNNLGKLYADLGRLDEAEKMYQRALQGSVTRHTGDGSTDPPTMTFGTTASTSSHAGTEYSVKSSANMDSDTEYIRAFALQLMQDLDIDPDTPGLSDVPVSYMKETLRTFAWKLHEESSNPFQWGVSVTLREKREIIITELLGRGVTRSESDDDNVSVDDAAEMEDDEPDKPAFMKSPQDTKDWVDKVSASASEMASEPAQEIMRYADAMLDNNDKEYGAKPHSMQERHAPRLKDYKDFVQPSESYRWLLSKIIQHSQLSWTDRNAMGEIGTRTQHDLRLREPRRKMSHRRPLSVARVDFPLTWHPCQFIEDTKKVTFLANLERTVCITGSWTEAQATTITNYMRQTWPVSCECLLELLSNLSLKSTDGLVSSADSKLTARTVTSSSCVITVVAGAQHISEVAEQLAWLSATLIPSEHTDSLVARFPIVASFSLGLLTQDSSHTIVVSTCTLSHNEVDSTTVGDREKRGRCWAALFGNAVLVRGYPILRRSHPQTGLELSLGLMGYLVRSQQVVRYGDRVVMKGFNSLLIATLATSGLVLWHLLVSNNHDKRISYYDSRLDSMDLGISPAHPLRSLETARHIVGWCANADELCGHKSSIQTLKGCGLRETPASIVIDRLYIEGGMHLIGGVALKVNQKQDPAKLSRGKDYQGLLDWIKRQAVVFFDTHERRAWLVDGASALLHLVRTSLHHDRDDEDSTFDWKSGSTDLKDTWPGSTMRHAAVETLKNRHNVNLPLYIRKYGEDGQPDVYTTFQDRVLAILHSLEILVETQSREAEKGDIKIRQTKDQRTYVIGYDVLDLLSPRPDVQSRIAHFDTWGDGWMDLLRSIKALTLFGQGYGDLVRPKDSSSVCAHWKTVPMQKDYMCASMSTLRVLRDEWSRRDGSTSNVSEFRSGLLWISIFPPFEPCRCSENQSLEKHEHVDPRQFFKKASRSAWQTPLTLKASAPIDFDKMRETAPTGAVVFANLGLLNRHISNAKDATRADTKDAQTPSSLTTQTSASISTAASATTSSQSTADATSTITGVTVPGTDPPDPEFPHDTSAVEKKDKGKRKLIRDLFRRK